jgi:hypothetical protein
MRVLFKISLFLLLILLLPISAQAQTEDDFFTLLETARIALAGASDLAPIRAQLAAIKTVTLADGRTVSIDTTYWIELLDEDAVDRAVAQIDATLASRQLPQPQTQPDARAQLADVLTRFEIDTQFSVPLWQRVMRWLGRWLQIVTRAGSGQIAGGALIIVAIVVTGLVILWATRRLRGEISAESSLPLLLTDDPDLSAQSAFDNAQQSAEIGDYRSAVRFLYLSALLSLDERNLLRLDRSKTNREYLRSVAGSEFEPTLRRVIDVFDSVWYGFRPIDPATFDRYQQQVRSLLNRA